jgi:DNA repair exonuclease SbcCD ATPase subunit
MTPEEIAVLKAEKEALAAKLKELSDGAGRLAYLEDEHKKLIADRDKAKEAARQAADDKLKADGEFKTLAEQKAAEAAEAVKRADDLETKIKAYAARDQKELDDLMGKVPENFKGLITDDLPLSKRLEMARAFAGSKITPPPFRGADEGGPGGNPWKKETRNLTEQAKILKENPTLAAQLRTEAGHK